MPEGKKLSVLLLLLLLQAIETNKNNFVWLFLHKQKHKRILYERMVFDESVPVFTYLLPKLKVTQNIREEKKICETGHV